MSPRLGAPRRQLAAAVSAVVLLVITLASNATAAPPTPAAASLSWTCPTPTPGHATCYSSGTLVKPVAARPGANPLATSLAGSPSGLLSATDFRTAYDVGAIPSMSTTGSGLGRTGAGGTGAGVWVGIVDAYDDPFVDAEYANYRGAMGLGTPDCTSGAEVGCLKVINQDGLPIVHNGTSGDRVTNAPAFNDGWAGEISLDVEMVAAMCPLCNVLLVEANSNGTGWTSNGSGVISGSGDLYTAVRTAATAPQNPVVVSLSLGGREFDHEQDIDDDTFAQPGVTYFAATGDNGWSGKASYPATSPNVIAVGGTDLFKNSSTSFSENAWPGAGSACSAYEAKPAWQSFIPNAICANRAAADVSAYANGPAGAAVYREVPAAGGPVAGWASVGGTSAATPIVATLAAIATTAGSYAARASGDAEPVPYHNVNEFTDVTGNSTKGCTPANNRLCTGLAHWDGPTGFGSPLGTGIAGFVDGTAHGDEPVNNLPGILTATAPSMTMGEALDLSSAFNAAGFSGFDTWSWKASKASCVVTDADSPSRSIKDGLTTNPVLTCNAGDTATTNAPLKLTATVVDGGSKFSAAVTVPTATVTANSVTPTLNLHVDGYADNVAATVCDGIASTVVATVLDPATHKPVKGISVQFKTGASTSSLGAHTTTVVTDVNGQASLKLPKTGVQPVVVATTLASGDFAALSGTSHSLTISKVPSTVFAGCAPSFSAAPSLMSGGALVDDPGYSTTHTYTLPVGGPVTLTGTLYRRRPEASTLDLTLPYAGVPVTAVLTYTGANGTVTKTLAKGTTDVSGNYALPITVNDTVGSGANGVIQIVTAASAATGPAVVSPSVAVATTSADIVATASVGSSTTSATSVPVKIPSVIGGTVYAESGVHTPVYVAGLQVTVYAGSLKLGTATTNAYGHYAFAYTPKAAFSAAALKVFVSKKGVLLPATSETDLSGTLTVTG